MVFCPEYLFPKKKHATIEGEPVNRKEIVLKKDMGYVDNLIVWIGKHPYLSAAGLIVTFLGGGMALGQLYKSKDSDRTADIDGIKKNAGVISGSCGEARTTIRGNPPNPIQENRFF